MAASSAAQAWYDAVGNLTTITTPSGTTNHSYDAADRISSTGYLYDANGALLTDGSRSFTYDALGRLTGVSGPSLSASYVLDGDGNRLSETVNSVSTDFDLDLRGLPTVLVAGDRSFLPGLPSLGHAASGAWHSYLADAQGSVLQTIDATGTTSALVRYDPFGGLRPGSAASSGIGYTGEWSDPTGLVNLRFRAYDPSLGRFISRDNFGGLPTMPQSANRHSYALGNPLRFADPSGHFVSALSGWVAGWPTGRPLPCGADAAYLAGCTAEVFQRMSTLERIAWLDQFQSIHGTGGWFNNIRGILRVAHERRVDGPWFSGVDSYILEGVALGKAAQLGENIAGYGNGGITLWTGFFVAQTQRTRVSDAELRRIWGVAEQAATDYGRSQSASLSRTMQDEIVLTGFGNAYRQAVSDPTGARTLASVTATAAANAACVAAGPFNLACQVVAAPIASVVAVHIADELSDPRNEWAAYQFTHWLYDANWPAQYVALP